MQLYLLQRYRYFEFFLFANAVGYKANYNFRFLVGFQGKKVDDSLSINGKQEGERKVSVENHVRVTRQGHHRLRQMTKAILRDCL